jgi:branched-chain amino acid transport system permease protein
MGSFFAHYYGSIVPTTFGPFKTLYVQVYSILGGVEFAILGPLIGSLIMTLIPEFLRIAKEVEPVFTGIIIVLLVIFLPDGLLGLLKRGKAQPPAKNLVSVARWIRGFLPSNRSDSRE